MSAYKPTTNYIKAQSDYDIGKKNQEDFLNKALTLYTGLKGFGYLAKNTELAKFGHTVADHYQQRKTPEWAKEEYDNPNKIFTDIAGTQTRTGYGAPDDGLFSMVKNMYSPSEEFTIMRDLGEVAQKQGRNTLVVNEDMPVEAYNMASQGNIGTAIANPYVQLLSALLAVGIGSDKQGSFLQKTFNKGGGY
tara:strand:+ start:3605 stop:4177 length:573 start_codon:yes stop_codon:yes gene_type:complete